MALRVGLEYDQPLGGIFCYSGFYSCFTKPSIFNQGTPIYIQHGEDDTYIDPAHAQETYNEIDKSKRQFTLDLKPDLAHYPEIWTKYRSK